jgi:hypothetical protein
VLGLIGAGLLVREIRCWREPRFALNDDDVSGVAERKMSSSLRHVSLRGLYEGLR